MVRTGKHLWDRHPGVNNDVTLGERAADFLKRWFGTWTALFSVLGWIALWILLQQTGIRFDPYPFILLNLCLSCLAAIQGIILQISANRQDRINAQASSHDREIMAKLEEQSNQLLDMQGTQMTILAELRDMKAGS